MNIEQIKKLNEMTKTLQQHGLATSSEEGSKLAGGITDVEVPKEKSVINKEYVELMFERNNRKMMQEIEALKAEIIKLHNSLESLKNQHVTERVVIREKEEEPERPVQNKQQIKKEDVKCGRDPDELNGVDVSVENIFYYGTR